MTGSSCCFINLKETQDRVVYVLVCVHLKQIIVYVLCPLWGSDEEGSGGIMAATHCHS
jgi:hypothetical protein